MTQPIVLLDSGVGGLTVLKSIVCRFYLQDCIYIADNAYFPYGTKTFDQLNARIKHLAHFIATLNPKAVVIACNTASVRREVFCEYLQCPVIDVIAPTCANVLLTTQNRRVCLLATDATIKSQCYQQILRKRGVDVVEVPCSDFVPIVEFGQMDSEVARSIVQNKLIPVANYNFDTVILGCTHFGLMVKQISKVLGVRNYVECGDATAQALCDVLQSQDCGSGTIQLVTTGIATTLLDVANRLNLGAMSVSAVQLPYDGV